MQFRVPQNITMEDRIVGPLSPIQFGIVVLGGGVSFVVFQSSLLPSPLNLVLGAALAIFTAVIAIGRFNGQPMYHFFKFMVMFVLRPRVRVWHKAGGGEVVLVKPTPPKVTEKKDQRIKNVSHADIAGLALVLDSRGNSGVVPHMPAPDQKKPKK